MQAGRAAAALDGIAQPTDGAMVIGGVVIPHGSGIPPVKAAVHTLPTPAQNPRSERPAADNYAEWIALDARLQAGEAISDADARWHRTYPQSAQFRAEAKRKAAA